MAHFLETPPSLHITILRTKNTEAQTLDIQTRTLSKRQSLAHQANKFLLSPFSAEERDSGLAEVGQDSMLRSQDYRWEKTRNPTEAHNGKGALLILIAFYHNGEERL